MTGYVKTKDGAFIEYPYGAAELQRDNPEANYPYECDFVGIFPTTPAATTDGFELFPVTVDEVPEYDGKNQTVFRSDYPFVRDGAWVFSWNIVDLTAEQIAAIEAMQAELLNG